MDNKGNKNTENEMISHSDYHAATGHKALKGAITHFIVFKG